MKLETKQIKFFKTNGYLKIKNYIPLKIFDDIKEIISPWVDDKISNWLKDELISNDYAKKNFNQRFLYLLKTNLDAGHNSNFIFEKVITI